MLGVAVGCPPLLLGALPQEGRFRAELKRELELGLELKRELKGDITHLWEDVARQRGRMIVQ